jgi:hypothetical protein
MIRRHNNPQHLHGECPGAAVHKPLPEIMFFEGAYTLKSAFHVPEFADHRQQQQEKEVLMKTPVIRPPVLLTALLALLCLAPAAPARAQVISLYFREAARDGKVYVFNSPAAWKTFRDGGAAPAAPITVPGYGPHGEVAVFENQSALDLYNFKHDKTPDDATDRLIEAQRSAAPAPVAVAAAPASAPAPSAEAAKSEGLKIAWKPGGLVFTLPNFELKTGARMQFQGVWDDNEYCGDCFNVLGTQSTTTLSTGATVVTNLPLTSTVLGNATTGRSYATNTLSVRRVKPFISGWAFNPRFKYELQYEASAGGGASNLGLREADVDIEFSPAVQLKIGQWKGPYGRQRIMSDGKNEFVEPSLATSTFAMGFEDGVMLYGFFGGPKHDLFEYNLGVFNGTGQNPANQGGNSDDKMLYAARFVWTPFGKYENAESAVDNPQQFKMHLGGSWNTNRNTAGVGTLRVTDTRTDKWGVELGGKYRIFSFNGEWFRADTRNDSDVYASVYNPATGAAAVRTQFVRSETDARGWYAQAGVFAIPKKLEFAFRWSEVDPNRDVEHQSTTEWRVGTNWYFSESHFHKLQFDIGKIRREFNGKFVLTPLTLPAVLPAGQTSFSFDDRNRDETQARLQYQIWF